MGPRRRRFYHITVADSAACRDGRHVERLGFYNPIAKGRSEGLRVDLDRVDYWLSVGAQASAAVKRLLKQARRNAAAPVEAAAAS